MAPTIEKLLKHTNGIDRFDAEVILAHLLRVNREYIIAHPKNTVTFFQSIGFYRLVGKRKRGIPVAYLTRHKEFFGLNFFVNKHTLVPRPETELMVELVLKLINEKNKDGNEEIILIDIGTGTGCIPISVIKSLKSTNIKALATDISRGALHVAKKNARKHGAGITFVRGNLFEPVIKIFEKAKSQNTRPKSYIVTANLPYLTQEQFDSEVSIQHEPHHALVATDDGLALYKKLIQELKVFSKKEKIDLNCFFEIDPSQAIRLQAFIEQTIPQTKINIHTDLSGNDRIVTLSYN